MKRYCYLYNSDRLAESAKIISTYDLGLPFPTQVFPHFRPVQILWIEEKRRGNRVIRINRFFLFIVSFRVVKIWYKIFAQYTKPIHWNKNNLRLGGKVGI